MRRLGGEVWQRASGITADAGASGLVDRPSRWAPESSEGRDARRADLVAWTAGLDVAGRGLARGPTLRKSMWVMVRPALGVPVQKPATARANSADSRRTTRGRISATPSIL